MVRVLPGIAEPDTAFLSDLPEKRPAICGEQERHVVHAPRPAGRLLLGSNRIATAIASGLFDSAGNVSALAFRFHNGHWGQANESYVVCRSVAGRPFCYRQITTPYRSGTGGVRQRLRVCFPASLAQLLINDATYLGLVEIKCLNFVLCLFDDSCTLLGGCLHSLGLEFGQALLKLLPLVCELWFGFSGQC
jgi:hypothetical protein